MRFKIVWHNRAGMQDGNLVGEFYPIEADGAIMGIDKSISPKTERKARKRWRFRYSMRHLMALVTLVSLGLSFCAVYFAPARLDGDVRFSACMCGPVRAKVSDGRLILLETHHETPAGTVVATIEIKDGMCTFRRIGTDGTPGPAARLYVDHLGAKYYDETDNFYPYYILVDDNWKQYPAALEAMVGRATRQSVW